MNLSSCTEISFFFCIPHLFPALKTFESDTVTLQIVVVPPLTRQMQYNAKV